MHGDLFNLALPEFTAGVIHITFKWTRVKSQEPSVNERLTEFLLGHKTTKPIANLMPLDTSTEEFENKGFTLKTHQMFSAHTTSGNFRTQLWICVWRNVSVYRNVSFGLKDACKKLRSRTVDGPNSRSKNITSNTETEFHLPSPLHVGFV